LFLSHPQGLWQPWTQWAESPELVSCDERKRPIPFDLQALSARTLRHCVRRADFMFAGFFVMAIDALVLPLLHVPLFQGLKPLQITEIARRADRVVYKPGDVIVTSNVDSDAAVLVVSGEAVRTDGPGLTEGIEAVPPGALISEMAMLIETECSSTVVARTTVRALRITRAEMLAHMAADPTLADHFIEKISGRLSSFVEGLQEIDRSLGMIAGTPSAAVVADIAATSNMAGAAPALH
jgi:CRP-like cAMP-binding protein